MCSSTNRSGIAIVSSDFYFSGSQLTAPIFLAPQLTAATAFTICCGLVLLCCCCCCSYHLLQLPLRAAKHSVLLTCSNSPNSSRNSKNSCNNNRNSSNGNSIDMYHQPLLQATKTLVVVIAVIVQLLLDCSMNTGFYTS